MEKWIIIHMQKPKRFELNFLELEEIAVCDPFDGHLLVFDSLDEASAYQEENGISGQCYELPIY